MAAATNKVTSDIARHGKVRHRCRLSCFCIFGQGKPSAGAAATGALTHLLSLSLPTSSPPASSPPGPIKQTFAFLSTTGSNGSVVACPTDAFNGTVSSACSNAVINLNAFAPSSGAATAVVGGVSVQGLLAYVVVANTVAKKQAVVVCDVNYLTGAFSGCVDSGAVFSGIAAVTPGLKGARIYAASTVAATAAAAVAPVAPVRVSGSVYECALSGKAISKCVQTGSPASAFNGPAQMALATRGFAFVSNAGVGGANAGTIAKCNVIPETGLLSNCSIALSSANAQKPYQIVERDGEFEGGFLRERKRG